MAALQTVLITGASSGIGAALARACARPGTTLHLSGRDADRLAAVAADCAARGATALPKCLDVRDAAAMAAWIADAGRLDLVIANAGISAGASEDWLAAPERARAIMTTNIDGVLNTALPALRVMAAQAPALDAQ
jgi:NADP-dependent 3-hydroxy acid dehydrogenase YdfG